MQELYNLPSPRSFFNLSFPSILLPPTSIAFPCGPTVVFRMRFSSCISILTLAAEIASAGRSLQHVGKKDLRKPMLPKREPFVPPTVKRAASSTNSTYLNDKSKSKFCA